MPSHAQGVWRGPELTSLSLRWAHSPRYPGKFTFHPHLQEACWESEQALLRWFQHVGWDEMDTTGSKTKQIKTPLQKCRWIFMLTTQLLYQKKKEPVGWIYRNFLPHWSVCQQKEILKNLLPAPPRAQITEIRVGEWIPLFKWRSVCPTFQNDQPFHFLHLPFPSQVVTL